MISETYLILLFLACIAGLIFVFGTKPFGFIDKSSGTRIETVDGLRFFLAVGVAMHHSIVLYSAFHSPTFDFVTKGYPVLWRVGRYAVALFFMISAFLFVDRIQNTKSSLYNFAKNRIFRILPLAYISVIVCYTVSFSLGYGIGPKQSLMHLDTWQAIVIAPFAAYTGVLKGLLAPSVGVLWTLTFEWGLYLALPFVTALRNRIGKITVSLGGAIAFALAMPHYVDGNYRFIFCFLLGFLAKDLAALISLGKNTKSVIAIICIMSVLLSRNEPICVTNLVALFVAFTLIVSGGDLFGLLNKKGATRLGEISFGIYLIHGPFLFTLTYTLSSRVHNNLVYCLLIVPVILFVCLTSALLFKFVERPAVSLGKRLNQKG